MANAEYFNPAMFKLAREFRGYTQKELDAASGIQQNLLSRYEHSIRIPTEDHLDRISEALNFPRAFFSQQGDDYPTGIIFHRKKSALKVRDKLRIEAEAKMRLFCLKSLLPELEVPKNLPHIELEDYSDNATEIAQAVRHFWEIPTGPIKQLVGLLEDNGIVVCRFDFGTELLDGFFINDDVPCIAVNSRFPMDRQRFTLAHELGHLLMHRIPNDHAEEQANLFASEFLMPAADMDQFFRAQRIDLSFLGSLKPIWRVSIAALLKRAHDLNYITDSNAKRLNILINKFGYRKKEPIPLDIEPADLLKEIIQTYKDSMEYTDSDLIKIMHLSQQDYFRFFNPFQMTFWKSAKI